MAKIGQKSIHENIEVNLTFEQVRGVIKRQFGTEKSAAIKK
jgi:hypothetical protein